MQRPHGACWAITAKGMGCPLLPSSSPHPTACGPTPFPPARLGAAPVPFASLTPQMWRAGRRQAPPSFQTAAKGGGWARASRCTARQPLQGLPPASPVAFASLAKPVGLCRSLRRCSVATGPRMMVGRLSPSACGTRAGHHAPGTGALRSAPPALAGQNVASRAGPGASAGCGASLSRRSLPPCPPCTAVCASAHAARRAVVCPRASQPPDAQSAAYSGALPLHPFFPGGHGPPAPHSTGAPRPPPYPLQKLTGPVFKTGPVSPLTSSFPVPAALWRPVYRTAHRAR